MTKRAIATNRSAPTATVVPILIYPDVADAIEWLCMAFGFSERLRAARDGIVGHAQLAVGEGAIMLGRQGGPYRPPAGDHVTAYVHLTVDDVDEHFARAKAAGARIVQPPADMPFGERQYTAADPAGHWWTFSQHIANVAPELWGATPAAPASDVAPTLQSATPVFLVNDIAATIPWYKRTLGFDGDAVPKSPPHTFAILWKDDVVIFLQQLAGYERPDVYRQREGGVWSAYLRTANVRALFDAVRDLPDVTVIKPPRQQAYGEIEFEIKDPNGYVLVFAERA